MTLIRQGWIVDGTGAPGFRGDVLIDGDKIQAVVPGALVPAPDCAVVDATDCLVTPGFIDAHAHSDAYLVLEPSAPSKVMQGITTEINGQCGGSAVPRYGAARLSSDWATLLGDQLTWRSLAEYRTVLTAAQPAVNTVQFIGHNTLRASVVGYDNRPATAEEMQRMEALLTQMLEEGGRGLSSGLIYQPGRYATPEEVERLARVAARKGGFYATHMRSEGDFLLESLDEVIKLAEKTGIRAEISHLKTWGEPHWHKLEAAIAKVEAGMATGVLLGADRYPYCAAGTDLDLVLDEPLDDWARIVVGGTWSAETKPYAGRAIAEIAAAEQKEPQEVVRFILEKDASRTGAFFFAMCEANLDKLLACPWIVPGSDASLRAPWGPLGADYPHPRAYGTMPTFYRRLRQLGISREAAIRRMTSLPAARFGVRGRGCLAVGAFADVAVWREQDFRSPATYAAPHQFATGIEALFVNGVLTVQNGTLTPSRAGRFLD